MAFTTLKLASDLLDHLNTDAGVVALVGAGAVFHSQVQDDEKLPLVLISLPSIDMRDGHGFGDPQTTGQVADLTVVLAVMDERPDPSGLAAIADAVDDALRIWAPTDWSLRQVEAQEERLATRLEEGQTIQSGTMVYRVLLERT